MLLIAACTALPALAQAPVDEAVRTPRGVTRVEPGVPIRISAGGAVLDVDAGAVEDPLEISVTPTPASEFASLDGGMANVTNGGIGYRFGPHGTRFRKHVRLTLPYDPSLLPPGMTEQDVHAFYFDETRGRWIALERVKVDSRTLTIVSLTDHFTDIIAATLATPTHPEVASFVPTMMQDMKAADPGEGIDLIQPPQADPLGEAKLTLPIEVPPGRNNLQPSLAITYQSLAGNGWLGAGWLLQVPEIVVDTRWGVPRYGVMPDSTGAIAYRDLETESYLMNGLELTPVSHRSAFEPRVGNAKTFRSRVEGGFERVIRHGDHPTSFWWEVVGRDGVRSIYGDAPGVGPGPGTLRDEGGNVFRWALREVRDLHGNAMRFEYDLVSDAGIPGGTVPGRQLYLRRLDYTGRSVGGAYQPGAYTVEFIRDSHPSLAPWARRRDVSIDCRGGFKLVTAELLRQVRVQLDGEMIRQYELGYDEGAFAKSRLVSVRVRGADGTLFPGNEHRFEYFDDVRDGSGSYSAGFAPESPWSVPFDDLNLCTDLGPVDICPSLFAPDYDRATALGGAITHDIGGHLYLGLNCGAPTKQNSGGGKVGFNQARTDSRAALLDVNGDNLPDKVFRSGSSFVFRENLGRPGGSPSFSAFTRPLPSLDAISTETATSFNGGAEAYFFGTTAIANASGTLTVGTTYSTDANGDGLVDVVKDGQILFGNLDAGGNPVFEPTSANTPMPLARGVLDGDGLIKDYEPLFQDLVDQNPLLDVFRRWLAPFDGFIRVSGGVRLGAPAATPDGVRVSIQHNETALWSQVIPAGDAQAYEPTGVERIAVSRGDRLYFRVQSVFEGSRDAVLWDPMIEYLDVPPHLDANGLDQHRYRASEDFVLAGRAAQARVPYTGEVRVTGVFEKPDTTSDDVAVTIRRRGAELFRMALPWDSVGSVTLDVRFNVTGDDTATRDVDESDLVDMQILVDSPIDVRGIGWRPDAPPELIYESAVGVPVRDPLGNPLIRIFVPYSLDLYPATDLETPQFAWGASRDGTVSASSGLGGFWSFRDLAEADLVLDGEIVFTVKRRGALLAKGTIQVRDGLADNISLGNIAVSEGDSLHFDYSARNLHDRGVVSTLVVYQALPPDASLGASALHTNYDFDDVAVLGHGLFGQPYRGWAYAGYNGNPARGDPERPHACSGPRTSPTAVIREADLVFDGSLAHLVRARGRGTAAQAITTSKALAFSPVHERLPGGTLRASWRGRDEAGWIQAAAASSSRLGLDLIGVPCASDLGGGVADGRAVPRIGNSVNGGVGAGFFIAVTGSIGDSDSELDFVDLNGDQFPDVVGNGRVQFTRPDGGLERRNRALGPAVDPIRDADNLAGSISIGGSVPNSESGSRGTNGAGNKSAPRGERVDNIMPSLGFSGQLGTGSTEIQADLIDLNGDGLPDRVRKDGTVQLNLGYTFAAQEAWPGLSALDDSDSREFTLSAELGFNDFIYGFAGGLSYSRAESRTHHSLLDLNGDGLVDRVRDQDDALWVGINSGSGFEAETRWQGAAIDNIATTANAKLGTGAYFTVGVPVFLCSPFTVLFVIINPGVEASAAMARQEEALLDVDGDRCPDHVRSTRDDELVVARNRTGRTNLLRRVERPLHGSFTLDYERAGNTPDLPQSAWVLSRVELFDGLADDGPSPLLTTYAYASPRYDRGEREFFGFGEVREEHRPADDPGRVARVVARSFRNDSYYSKGLVESETTFDADGRPYHGADFGYEFRDVGTQAPPASLASRTATIHPMLVRTETRIGEGVPAQAMGSRRQLEYDAEGNVTRVVDTGDAGPEDDLEATITYAACPAPVSRPTSIVVRSNGVTLTERQATLDCVTGDVVQIRESTGTGTEAVTDLAWNEFGLLRSVTGPANLHGQRYALEYEYDPRLATHVTRIEDGFGLVSRASHDLRFGRPVSTTDPNGNVVSYTYDAFGRATTVTGPYEQGTGQATLRFEHHPDAPVPWARTRHFDVLRGPADPIETILFADGLGRIVQTKVDGTVHTAPEAPARDVMIVSGRTRHDFLGRAAEQYQPVVEPLGQGPLFNAAFDPFPPSRIEHDVLDRPTVVTEPDHSTTRYRYALAPDRGGRLRSETTIEDAAGGRRQLYRDPRGLLVAVREGAAGDLWTSYEYDALDRLVSMRDAHQNRTRMEYDALGRRTLLERPDAGTTRYEYDAASNLVALRTANLLARGVAIRYDYDFTRLRAIQYPDEATPGVTYEYGGPGAPANGAGRLLRITDRAGAEERSYGRLGEVVRQTRTVVGHAGWNRTSPQTFTTAFAYDTWGRLLSVLYPDQERVEYDYDAGGLVRRAVGTRPGGPCEYVRRLEYDRFRQQAFLELGNGIRTRFHYRPDDQRLERLESASASGPAAGVFQDLRYTYDAVGNVLSLANEVPVAPASGIGGPVLQQFRYDDLYRLVGATGVFRTSPRQSDEYSLSLHYDGIHNLLEKRQAHDVVTPSGHRVPQHKTTYAELYGYSAAKPHAAVHVGSRTFSFDANGNQTGWTHDRNGTRRTIAWDAENRIESIADQGHVFRYAYDAEGARVLKRGPQGEVATFNQFFSVRNREHATSHVYVGGSRIASRIARGPGPGPAPRPASNGDDDDGDGGKGGKKDPPGLRDVFFYHPDGLGSTQFVTDGGGSVIHHLEYFPFGEIWVDEKQGPERGELAFSGRELDEETDLYYFGARYQDPRLGQFLSADPMSSADGEQLAASNPAALNVYSFAFDNPVRLSDPSGLAPAWWSRLVHTFDLFRGAVGRSLGGPRAPPPAPAMLDATDSPVRAAAAASGGDFTAAAGTGAIATGPLPGAAIGSTRERSNAVSLGARGTRGPPASITTADAATGPTRPRSNAFLGERAPEGLGDPGRDVPVVLGENMAGRVTPYARAIGGETIVDWLAGRQWTQQLNDAYIMHIRATGRQVIDIGPDFGRRLRFKLNPPADRGPRPVYESERQLLRGYTRYRQVFVRTGKFEGGVPGLDRPGRIDGGVGGIQP